MAASDSNFDTPQTFEDEPFSVKFPFASAVKRDLGAWGYTVVTCPAGRKFSSGRPILIFEFYRGNGSAREVLATHDGMVLTSKAGQPYHVVSRLPSRVRPIAAP
jgi:hypothetical protein